MVKPLTTVRSDVILIDGGKGQLAQAKNVFELDVSWDKNHPLLLGVAKGANRKTGLETLFFEPEGEDLASARFTALHVIQHIRDESHMIAIGGHRKKRAKVKNTSSPETIEGVGPKTSANVVEIWAVCKVYVTPASRKLQKCRVFLQGLAERSSGR